MDDVGERMLSASLDHLFDVNLAHTRQIDGQDQNPLRARGLESGENAAERTLVGTGVDSVNHGMVGKSSTISPDQCHVVESDLDENMMKIHRGGSTASIQQCFVGTHATRGPPDEDGGIEHGSGAFGYPGRLELKNEQPATFGFVRFANDGRARAKSVQRHKETTIRDV